MDGIKIQEKVYKGYAIAARKIGLIYSQYRSATAIQPIVVGNRISTTFYASFNVSWDYMKSSKYGNAVFQCVADGRVLQVGDYLVGQGKTSFIIGMENLLPILSVECNAIATIQRPTQLTTKGSVGYVGYVAGNSTTLPTNSTVIMQDVPISILENGRGMANPNKLPMDSEWGRWLVLMPYLGSVQIKVADVIKIGTDLYTVDSNELTDFGWRIRAKRVTV